jgi:alpha-tubulin suppressor-like RCC1 family protein
LFEERKAIATPTLVEYFLDRKMKMAAAGTNHSLFLSDLGQVFSAGFNEFGQLGIAVEELRQQDIQIEQIDNWVTSLKESAIKQVDGLEGIRYIAAGAFHSLAVSDMNSDEGKKLALFSWGWGAYGQLGHSKIRDSFNLRKPKQVKFR